MSQIADQKPRTTDPQRAKLLRLLHAHAAEHGVSHDTLSQGARQQWGCGLGDLTVPQLRDYVQRVCTRLSSATPSPRRHPRPSGKRRAEGVVWLPTPRQRSFIARLLDQYFGDDRDPVACAARYVHRRIGNDLRNTDVPPANLQELANQVQTGKAAGQLINALIGDLKRAGRWGTPREALPKKCGASPQKCGTGFQPVNSGDFQRKEVPMR